MENYIYFHKTNNGTVFYVGKGIKNRAFNLNARSDYHKRIAKKHGCQVEIVLSGLSEELAIKYEIELIAKYKKLGQCQANFTIGGEGRLGLKHSKDTKLKMSKAHQGKSSGMLGKKMSKESSEKKSKAMRDGGFNTKPIKCIDNGLIFKSLSEAVMQLNLSGTSNLAKVLAGTRSHVNGLRFKYV